MRYICYLPVAILLLGASIRQSDKPTGKKQFDISLWKELNMPPKVQLSMKLQKDTFKFGEAVTIIITITNNTDKTQTLLFDKPELWGFSGDVMDLSTGQSVVSYHNRSVLSSQVYFEETLRKYYYHIKSGESLSTKTNLQHIVIFNTEDYNLSKGRYEMELNYGLSTSNKVVFWVD